MSLLQIDQLRVKYGDQPGQGVVLDGVSLTVARGEWVTIVGPSGCGKTTLLHCIVGTRAYEGRIACEAAEIGYVFQTPRLLPWLTVRENIAIVLRPREADEARVQTLVTSTLDRCQIGILADRYPASCSEGEKARVALARALVLRPALILMDEPFGSLDQLTAEALRQEVKQLAKTLVAGVLFVTHNLMEAAELSDRVIAMSAKPSRVAHELLVDKGGNEAPSPEAMLQTVQILRAMLQGG